MNKRPCPHGVCLPKGLRCNHGYIEVLIKHDGRLICKTFNQHDKEGEELASIWLAQKRKEIREGKIGIEPQIKTLSFREVAPIWFRIWSVEKDPDGRDVHSDKSRAETWRVIQKTLNIEFGDKSFDSITTENIQDWWDTNLASGLLGTTLNRYVAVMSSIYSHTIKWVESGKIKPAFKLPLKNPCLSVEKAKTRKRERILTKYEAKKLKLSFMNLKDSDGWEICKLALQTVLSLKDLHNLEIGQEIDIERAKTGVPVNLPITVLVQLNWKNWRNRWERAREDAGLKDVQFRDLRKTGINWLKGKHDLKLVSEYAGHADIKTTEASYTIKQSEYLLPLAQDLKKQVEEL